MKVSTCVLQKMPKFCSKEIRFMVNALVGRGVLGVNPSVSPCVVKKESLVDVGGKVAMLVYIAPLVEVLHLDPPEERGDIYLVV